MRAILVLIALGLRGARAAAGEGCPSLCSCRGGRSGGAELAAETGEATDWLRLKCGGGENPISELKEIDLTKVADSVVTLNLSGNAISTLSRELHLTALQKLDLSKNQISLIESDAFYNLSSLQRLDLSSNRITGVSREVFKGLVNLERLLLGNNRITALTSDMFDYLVALKQLDISSNPLHCDCALLLVSEWARDSSVKLAREPGCASPPGLAGKPLSKLRRELAHCSLAAVLQLRPPHSQVVFEGDSLTLNCRAPFTPVNAKYELRWIHPMLEICDVNMTSIDVLEEGLAETTVHFPNITDHHTGNWTCLYRDHNATNMSLSVEVVVISNRTQYCNVTDETNNKGLFSWPQLLVNRTASQSCGNSAREVATRRCLRNATGHPAWAPMDTAACPYISNITKMLQQFALLNVSLSRGALLAASQLALRIQQSTYPLDLINDPDDVHLIAQAVRNYMAYVTKEKDTAQYLLDVVSATMNVSARVTAAAERQYNACSELVACAEGLSQYTGNVQGHKSNMVMERFMVRRESFTGVTCVWYSRLGDPARRLHCSTSERSVAPPSSTPDNLIHCSVQIPMTLLYRVEHGAQSPAEALHHAHALVVAMYEHAALFPLFPEVDDDGAQRGHRLKDYYGRSTKREDMNMEITSPVVGVKLLNASMPSRLAEPVYVMVRSRGLAGGVDGRAAMWDPQLRRWSNHTRDCAVSHIIADMVVIRCFRLGYVGLLQNVETGIYGGRTDGARFKISHPAVYVGSLILLGCLACSTLTYVMCYSAIQMAKRTKHALVNTWVAIALLCFMYTLGIYQTEDVKLCQVLGLIIHYLSLSSLLWMVVSASNMYKWISKVHRPAVQAPDDEIPPDAPVQKPILGLYLVGWGIALIVCGISGAVNLRDYAAYAQCFLSTAPALSALFVPAGILLVFLMILFLLIRCTIRNVNGQLSEGTQATENVDLEMWEPTQTANETTERRSIRSTAESETEDVEHTPIIQLRAQVIVLSLYMSVWTCGAVAVYRPFPAYLPYQEDICSIMYAVCATVLGTFILFFYGIARSDVRAQWMLMHCYLKKSKQCCRNRSVFDANAQNVPSNRPAVPTHRSMAGDNNSRSGSRSSNRTNSKTNNSGTFKGGAELNGHTLHRDSVKNGNKIANINLVVLHRQQYRSNNSVMTYQDNGAPGPEVFYNPNQSNVARKFFKKQKQHMKKNCLELPTRRDYDTDSHMSLPLPTKEAYGGMAHIINSGSKVNNTNLHVEKGQHSDTGIKETRNVQNPNILEDEKPDNIPYKNYSTDRNLWNKADDAKNRSSMIMNIYTNVPETTIPQHQVITPESQGTHSMGGSISEECMQRDAPEMRTISQQCSLDYSSASEIAMPLNHTCSDQTLNTHSEMTSLQETHSALCSTNEITDTESFGQYIDYLAPVRNQDNAKLNERTPEANLLDKSLQDISEECTANSEEMNRSSTPHNLEDGDLGELDTLIQKSEEKAGSKEKLDEDKEAYFMAKNTYDFETCSTNASEQGFENESDIYCPNYQLSEVSIRSHGLYAPSPASMCPHEISFSHEDVSNTESQYVNYDPAWRKTVKSNPRMGKFVPSPALSCPDVNRDNTSPVSFASELDELYTQITSRDKSRAARKTDGTVLDQTINSDVTLKPCDSDSCVSEVFSDTEVKAETTV